MKSFTFTCDPWPSMNDIQGASWNAVRKMKKKWLYGGGTSRWAGAAAQIMEAAAIQGRPRFKKKVRIDTEVYMRGKKSRDPDNYNFIKWVIDAIREPQNLKEMNDFHYGIIINDTAEYIEIGGYKFEEGAEKSFVRITLTEIG